jgi:phosphoribosylaminoimidazolecarboxamide formyltransferase/IMP cyclohydrolase
MGAIRRALLSVSDTSGLADLASGLARLGVELLATGGTADALAKAGCTVVRTESLTGFADLLDGRVKTLHPAIHAGLLARRDVPAHLAQLQAAGYGPIDLVVVNLYPFERTVAAAGVTEAKAIEQIDIGGVALLRSGAKNHAAVAVLCDPTDYGAVLEELRSSGGSLSDATRKRLAAKAYRRTAEYDAAIANWLASQSAALGAATGVPGSAETVAPAAEPGFPNVLTVSYRKRRDLRYGENPHQAAAAYVETPERPGSLASARLLNGKEPSHNNLLDFDAGLALVTELDGPACAVIKHRNPCGCAEAASLADAIRRAALADTLSAFGGMVAVNRRVGEAEARAILDVLNAVNKFDGIVAPSFDDAAVRLIAEKPKPFPGRNILLLSLDSGDRPAAPGGRSLRSVDGGLLVQEADRRRVTAADLTIVTKRAPTEAEIRELLFAWTVAKHTVSNAIVLTRDRATVGIGAGQVNRVGSVAIAVRQAGAAARGACLGSDAFFPYPDGVEEAGKAGVAAIIQPGGSVKDPETIAAADRHGMAMVLTGVRHFKH